jgi:CDP-diacylglycerol--glycerol-3-phosphate 3-phosphatidyltransferase
MKILINFLTYSRIACGLIIFLLVTIFESYGSALLIFFYASISDFLDGYFARKYKLTSVLGAILDPIADKILILFSIIALTIHLESLYFGFIGSVMLAREFWVAALRDFNARNGNQEATEVTFLAKIKTSTQLVALGSYLVALYLNSALILFLSDFLFFLALIITIQTGIQYSLQSFKKTA